MELDVETILVDFHSELRLVAFLGKFDEPVIEQWDDDHITIKADGETVFDIRVAEDGSLVVRDSEMSRGTFETPYRAAQAIYPIVDS